MKIIQIVAFIMMILGLSFGSDKNTNQNDSYKPHNPCPNILNMWVEQVDMQHVSGGRSHIVSSAIFEVKDCIAYAAAVETSAKIFKQIQGMEEFPKNLTSLGKLKEYTSASLLERMALQYQWYFYLIKQKKDSDISDEDIKTMHVNPFWIMRAQHYKL